LMRIELTTFPITIGMRYHSHQLAIERTILIKYEPLMRIELTTSSLPRKCSTPELQWLLYSLKAISSGCNHPKKSAINSCGAGDEARTRDLQLGRLSLYQLSYSRR
jgi:hypothetical protein